MTQRATASRSSRAPGEGWVAASRSHWRRVATRSSASPGTPTQLAETADLIEAEGGRMVSRPADVSDADAVADLATFVHDQVGRALDPGQRCRGVRARSR